MDRTRNGKEKSFVELMQERRQRAEQGLADGAYTVEVTGKEKGSWAWTVHGPHGDYTVTARKEEGRWRWQCECEDFRRHADHPAWQCKHIHMVKLTHRADRNGRSRDQEAAPEPATAGDGDGTGPPAGVTATSGLGPGDVRELLRLLAEVVEQLQEVNKALRAIDKTLAWAGGLAGGGTLRVRH